jgi:hypothetical protein
MPQFASLGDLKEWLTLGQTAFPPTDDRLLTRLLVASSAVIESYLNRPVGLATYEETIDDWGGWRGDRRLVLCVTPIVSVVSLVVGGIAVPPAPNAHGSGYFIYRTHLTLQGWWFPSCGPIVVRYTGGYAVIPDDIVEVCLEMAARKYKERGRIGQRSASIGGAETVSYDTLMFGTARIASDIQAMLNSYRRVSQVAMPTLISPPP